MIKYNMFCKIIKSDNCRNIAHKIYNPDITYLRSAIYSMDYAIRETILNAVRISPVLYEIFQNLYIIHWMIFKSFTLHSGENSLLLPKKLNFRI